MTNQDDVYEEIYQQLDALMKNKESADAIQREVNTRYTSKSTSFVNNTFDSATVKRPAVPLPSSVSYNGRYDCFVKILEKVDYGSYNANEYVKGHSEALNKYHDQALTSSKDLSMVEGRLKDEITKYNHIEKTNLYVKGYYDGLLYVYRALKNSKDAIVEEMIKTLQRGLN